MPIKIGVIAVDKNDFIIDPLNSINKRLILELSNIDYTFKGWNYFGPGTRIFANILNKIQPVSELDAISMVHDIEVTASDKYTADKKFVDTLNARGYGLTADVASSLLHLYNPTNDSTEKLDMRSIVNTNNKFLFDILDKYNLKVSITNDIKRKQTNNNNFLSGNKFVIEKKPYYEDDDL